jgi:hypothetical protein
MNTIIYKVLMPVRALPPLLRSKYSNQPGIGLLAASH